MTNWNERYASTQGVGIAYGLGGGCSGPNCSFCKHLKGLKTDSEDPSVNAVVNNAHKLHKKLRGIAEKFVQGKGNL